MIKSNSVFVRVIGVLLLVGLIAGAGVMVYQAGRARGIVQAPEMAEALESAVESGQVLPFAAQRFSNDYPGFKMHPRSGFLPGGGIFGFILFGLLFFGLMRLIFFRRMPWHYGPMYGRGPWEGQGHPWGTPPWARGAEEGKPGTEPEQEK